MNKPPVAEYNARMIGHTFGIDEQYGIQWPRRLCTFPVMTAMILEIIFAVQSPYLAIFQILDIKQPVPQIGIDKLEKSPAVQPFHRPAPVAVWDPEILADDRLFYIT